MSKVVYTIGYLLTALILFVIAILASYFFSYGVNFANEGGFSSTPHSNFYVVALYASVVFILLEIPILCAWKSKKNIGYYILLVFAFVAFCGLLNFFLQFIPYTHLQEGAGIAAGVVAVSTVIIIVPLLASLPAAISRYFTPQQYPFFKYVILTNCICICVVVGAALFLLSRTSLDQIQKNKTISQLYYLNKRNMTSNYENYIKIQPIYLPPNIYFNQEKSDKDGGVYELRYSCKENAQGLFVISQYYKTAVSLEEATKEMFIDNPHSITIKGEEVYITTTNGAALYMLVNQRLLTIYANGCSAITQEELIKTADGIK